MKNDKNLNLVEGNWYLVVRRGTELEIVLKYTKSTEDAYYVSHLFSDTCNVEVLGVMQRV